MIQHVNGSSRAEAVKLGVSGILMAETDAAELTVTLAAEKRAAEGTLDPPTRPGRLAGGFRPRPVLAAATRNDRPATDADPTAQQEPAHTPTPASVARHRSPLTPCRMAEMVSTNEMVSTDGMVTHRSHSRVVRVAAQPPQPQRGLH